MIEVSFPDFDIDYITIDIAGTGQYFHCFNGLKRCDNMGAGLITPAVSQVMIVPPAGLGKIQRRQGVHEAKWSSSFRSRRRTPYTQDVMFKTGIIDEITSLHVVKASITTSAPWMNLSTFE